VKGSGRCAGNSLSMSQTPLHAELHTAYAAVAPLSTKYPAQEGALFQTFVDLKYAARWRFLEVHDVQRSEIADPAFGKSGWAIVTGQAPNSKVRIFGMHKSLTSFHRPRSPLSQC